MAKPNAEILDGGWAPTKEEAMETISRHSVSGEKVVEVDELTMVTVVQRLAEGSLIMTTQRRVVFLVRQTEEIDSDRLPILPGWSWRRIFASF